MAPSTASQEVRGLFSLVKETFENYDNTGEASYMKVNKYLQRGAYPHFIRNINQPFFADSIHFVVCRHKFHS